MVVNRIGKSARWLLPLAFLLLARPASAVNRVALTPATITLTEGQSQLVHVDFAEPIVSPSGTPYARLDLSDPSGRLSFDPASITVPASGWVTTYSFKESIYSWVKFKFLTNDSTVSSSSFDVTLK